MSVTAAASLTSLPSIFLHKYSMCLAVCLILINAVLQAPPSWLRVPLPQSCLLRCLRSGSQMTQWGWALWWGQVSQALFFPLPSGSGDDTNYNADDPLYLRHHSNHHLCDRSCLQCPGHHWRVRSVRSGGESTVGLEVSHSGHVLEYSSFHISVGRLCGPSYYNVRHPYLPTLSLSFVLVCEEPFTRYLRLFQSLMYICLLTLLFSPYFRSHPLSPHSIEAAIGIALYFVYCVVMFNSSSFIWIASHLFGLCGLQERFDAVFMEPEAVEAKPSISDGDDESDILIDENYSYTPKRAISTSAIENSFLTDDDYFPYTTADEAMTEVEDADSSFVSTVCSTPALDISFRQEYMHTWYLRMVELISIGCA